METDLKRYLIGATSLIALVTLTLPVQAATTPNGETPYSVDSSISPYAEPNIYYLVKEGDSWKVSKTADLTQEGVERVSVDPNLKLIRLKASAPTKVSAAERDRGPGSGNRWECFKRPVGGTGYREANSYSICSSELTKSVTTAGEAAIGSLNLLFGSVRSMVAVDQEKLLEIASSSGLIALAEQDAKDKIALEVKRKQDLEDTRLKAEQDLIAADRRAEQGDASAKYQRGLFFMGRQETHFEGEKWLEKAVAAGSADAAYVLGVYKYEQFRDEEEAEKLWTKAAQGGNVDAKKRLRELLAKKNQIAEEADRQAKEKQRVVAFRKSIKEGDESNCGPVIELKANLVKVAHAVSNYGNEHWIKRDQLFPSSYDCSFYNGNYRAPQY
ncbi:MAG: hypothetical protein PXX77_04230 [Gallionella sp.]|nr:hypothetical protein [Gallionella sp.]